jgi:type IV secretion system protein VirB4
VALDEERRAAFEHAEPAFETDHVASLTWLPPTDETRRLERWLFDGTGRRAATGAPASTRSGARSGGLTDLLTDALPRRGRWAMRRC